ncbi:MAG: dTMP kinase [Parerythrobacter sp.]
MIRGRFITLEGGEGTGKSTQARLLASTLRDTGRDVLITREPGGTIGAEAIRTLLLSPPDGGWNPRAEALLFAAARSNHVAALIEPALADGTWVVCDRFIDSSRAYQGVGNALGDAAINTLHELGSGGLLPDLTILIDVPPAVAHARVCARDGADTDAIGGRDAAYHEAVVAAFLCFAKEDPSRFARVNGEGTIEAVQARIAGAVARLMAGAP